MASNGLMAFSTTAPATVLNVQQKNSFFTLTNGKPA